MEAKPTTITAQEFVANDYAAKIAAGECVVKNPLYKKEIIISIELIKPNSANWDIAIIDTRSTYRSYSDTKLTVEWLPQADAKPDSGEALLPQTIHTVRYGTPEFEQLEREDCEREVARLQADLASAKAEAERLRAALESVYNKVGDCSLADDPDDNKVVIAEIFDYLHSLNKEVKLT